ncbi:MAG: 1-acyl-sn-glycerol-3-phosphate acyltransferase [Firmicutes bacterium]|nr:1-acyl-sn-glycerol-3-phosphate acyltransferase [Bacillota bacterium]
MIFYWLMHYLGKILMFPFLGVVYPLKILGKKNMPKNKKIIMVCNHLSFVDVLQVWVRTPGWRRFLAKDEVGKSLARPFVKATGTIFVNRDGNDMKAVRKCIAVLGKGQGLNIFPEGTRNKSHEDLQELQRGVAMFAIKTGATIVPINILHKSKAFCKNYLSFGTPFTLVQFEGIANRQNTEQGTQMIFEAMQQAKQNTMQFLQDKGNTEMQA